VSVEVRAGEVHALIGENGAGKSTLMNLIAGALQPDKGEMLLDRMKYSPASTLDARLKGVALIHQELSLCPHLTVAENILMGMEPSRAGWIDRKQMLRRASEVLETFHHADIGPDTKVANLSVAAQQIVEISRALAAQARILPVE